MIKKEIYPKTKRINCNGEKIEITEKLDGSNLVIFKSCDHLYIAQRNNIIEMSELEENKGILYKGLYEWLNNYKYELLEELHEDSAICGEWLGMGQIKYTIDKFDKRFYMFAKANFNLATCELYNINYTHELFVYPFKSQVIPPYIGIVPVVAQISYLPNKEKLDLLYEKYTTKEDRKVEGFVINTMNSISKYVRIKRGKVVEYSDQDHKNS